MVQTDIHDSVALLNTIFFTKPWHDTDDKEISHPKTEICWKFIQAMPDVEEFVSSSEQIWRNVALHDPLQWMGAVRMRNMKTSQ